MGHDHSHCQHDHSKDTKHRHVHGHHGHAHGHGHHHHPMPKGSKNILIAFVLNASFAVVEFVGGHLTNSVAIQSDAVHDLGDSLVLLFAFFAEKLSLKKSDEKFTFGYRRFSLLAGLVNGLILLAGSVYVLVDAVQRLQSPEPVHAPGMAGLAVLGILVNFAAAWRMRGDEGLNSKMISLHLLEDMLGWAAVLVVSLILMVYPWYFLDSALSIVIAVIILKGVYQNLLNIGAIFLQKFPEGLAADEIRETVMKFPHVEDVHLIKGWSIDESKFNLSLHVRVGMDTNMGQLDELRHRVESFLKQKNVLEVTIQFEGRECSYQSLPTT